MVTSNGGGSNLMPQHATRTSFGPGNRTSVGYGRPKHDVAVPTANMVAKLARSFGPEAIETLVKLMRDSEAPGAVRIRAAEAVLNRGIGLPAVAIDVTVQRVLAKKLCECTIEELRAIEQHLAEQAIDVTPAATSRFGRPRPTAARFPSPKLV
jgi:endonuclease III